MISRRGKDIYLTSGKLLCLVDGDGWCIVGPAATLVSTKTTLIRNLGATNSNVSGLKAGEMLYVPGYFITLEPNRVLDGEIQKVLRDWQRDPAQMMSRFDRNGDGKLDKDQRTACRSSPTARAGAPVPSRCLAQR